MPITLQNETVAPNTAFNSQTILTTFINGEGNLITSAQIVLTYAHVDADGKYSNPGQSVTEYIANVDALEGPLTALQSAVSQAKAGLLAVINAANQILRLR